MSPIPPTEAGSSSNGTSTPASSKLSAAAASRQIHRACDACAIRKVRCGPVKPCHHCVSNNLQCTQLRQKKKSGPKNLHRKTLQNINGFIGQQQGQSVQQQQQQQQPPQFPADLPIPSNAGSGIMSNTTNSNLPSPPHTLINAGSINPDVIEILSLIDQNQIVWEVVEDLTVSTLVSQRDEFIQIVKDTIPMCGSPQPQGQSGSSTSPSPPAPTQIGSTPPLSMHHLSKLCVAYTLCLLTLETVLNMIELNQAHFTLSKPIDQFKYLQRDLVLRVNEFSLVIETEIRLSLTPIDQIIFYNHSLVFLHLYNLYQICVVMLPIHRKENKFLHLRQSINYFQLLDSPQENPQLSLLQVYEVYEILFLIERLNFFLLDKNCIMNNNPVMLLDEIDFEGKRKSLSIYEKSFDGTNQLFTLLKTTLKNRQYLPMFKFFNNVSLLSDYSENSKDKDSDKFQVAEFLACCNSSGIEIEHLNALIVEMNSVEGNSESVYSSFMLIFTLLIIFKVDLARTILQEKRVTCNQIYLCELINRMNYILKGTDLCILKIKCHNYQLIPQLLTMLKVGIESLQNPDIWVPSRFALQPFELEQFRMQLVDFSHILLALSPKGYNLDQHVANSELLTEWIGTIKGRSTVKDESHQKVNLENQKPLAHTHTHANALPHSHAIVSKMSDANVKTEANDFGDNYVPILNINPSSTTTASTIINPDTSQSIPLPQVIYGENRPASTPIISNVPPHLMANNKPLLDDAKDVVPLVVDADQHRIHTTESETNFLNQYYSKDDFDLLKMKSNSNSISDLFSWYASPAGV